jgi:hypothetical protein
MVQKIYSCTCGFNTTDLAEFRRHLVIYSREGKGLHRSVRIAAPQQEPTEPPKNEAPPQPKIEETPKTEQSKPENKPVKAKAEPTLAAEKATTNPQEATQLRIVPRTFTITYTPIMMNAQLAAIREWGWPQDMSIENFLDTIIYHAFRDRGIILQGYVVADDHHFE